jgi:hypothetical protein
LASTPIEGQKAPAQVNAPAETTAVGKETTATPSPKVTKQLM